MSKVMYLFDHVKRVARDRQVKPVTDKSTASKIFQGLVIGRRDLPTLKKVYGKQAGYSLVELVVVVAIVGALATIAIPYYQSFAKKAQRVEAKSGLSGAFTSMVVYQMQNGGKGSSKMKDDLGFSMKGSPHYSYGFQSHKTSATDTGNNMRWHATNTSDANTDGTKWPSNFVNTHSIFKSPAVKCAKHTRTNEVTCKKFRNASGALVNTGCTWSPGNRICSGSDYHILPHGLLIGNNEFTIGAIGWFGNGSFTNSSATSNIDALLITQDREIIQANNGIK